MAVRAPLDAVRSACHRIVVALLCVCSAGCGTAPVASTGAPDAPIAPWRTLIGGFLAPAGAAFGVPARPGTGAFVKLVAPTALALRGNDLLIVDSGAGRLWRFDLALNTLSPVAGAPATPATVVALGPDLSAWVLDGVTRQVLRFARDGRLMQTYRVGSGAAAPVAMVLADAGATLLVADESQRQWVEFRPAGAFPIALRPGAGERTEVRGVDGLASGGERVFVLDRSTAVVHIVRRDGTVQARLGEGELKQPTAIAADRFGRVFVLDAQDRAIKLLSAGRPTQVFDASLLQVQLIGAIAVDERFLAVADRLAGQVVIHVVRPPLPP